MELKGKYIVSRNLETKFVNGVYGGPGVNNEIVMHLFYERYNIPDSYKISINDNQFLESTDKKSDVVIVREINSAVAMSLDTAKRVYDWLGKHIDTIEKGKKSNE